MLFKDYIEGKKINNEKEAKLKKNKTVSKISLKQLTKTYDLDS